MKWDIQKQIAKDSSGISDNEAHRIRMDEVMKDPILGPFWKRIRSARRVSPR
jgi:hypothetical protein